MGRQASNTKLGPKRVHVVRARGGASKFRALRLDTGNFSWGTEVCTKKTRVVDVVYNASNNELVRTKTLVKNAIVLVDATPFRTFYESHYGTTLVSKAGKTAKKEGEADDAKKSSRVTRKLAVRQKNADLDPRLKEQLVAGRILACLSSRPGQSGRADGYILEGAELGFYQKQLDKKKKGKK